VPRALEVMKPLHGRSPVADLSAAERCRRRTLATRPTASKILPQVFGYYGGQDISHVICEEKHMGSRAIVIVCRDIATTTATPRHRRWRIGICYTRTGRPFLADHAMEDAFAHPRPVGPHKPQGSGRRSRRLGLPDGEFMPWSLKAQGLLRQQYAPVGTPGEPPPPRR